MSVRVDGNLWLGVVCCMALLGCGDENTPLPQSGSGAGVPATVSGGAGASPMAAGAAAVGVAGAGIGASGSGTGGRIGAAGSAGGLAGSSGNTSVAGSSAGLSGGAGTAGGTAGGGSSGTHGASGTGGMGGVVGSAGASGANAGTGGGASAAPTFSQVFALIEQSCNGCHALGQGGLRMMTKDAAYTNLVDASARSCSSWKRVVPSNPEMSVLYHAIARTRSGNCDPPDMPPGTTKLEPEKVERIKAWIMAGAKND